MVEGGHAAVALDQSVVPSKKCKLSDAVQIPAGASGGRKKSYLRLLWANVEIKLHFWGKTAAQQMKGHAFFFEMGMR